MFGVGMVGCFLGYRDFHPRDIAVLEPGDRITVLEVQPDGVLRCARMDDVGQPLPDETETIFDDEIALLRVPPLAVRRLPR